MQTRRKNACQVHGETVSIEEGEGREGRVAGEQGRKKCFS